uniref:Mothers against decapentaplegic homolog n=1 Tax=Clytia hemisphaerica TaxID=252671 RepID=A0A069DMB1_9CNID
MDEGNTICDSQKKLNLINKLWKNSVYMYNKKCCMIKKILRFSKLPKDKEQNHEVKELRRKVHSIFKTLTEDQLDILLKTLQANGGIDSECILVNTSTFRHITCRTTSFVPRTLLAKVFRFPNLKDEYLRCLSCCYNHSSCDETKVCINPFHSSVVIESESPLPPYSELTPSTALFSESTTTTTLDDDDRHIPTHVALPRTPTHPAFLGYKDLGSTCSSTSSTSSTSSERSHSGPERSWYGGPWCQITYWEEKSRIGSRFDVAKDCVNVYETLPQGSGLDLSMLTRSRPNEASEKVKNDIGYGFQLTREADGIWLYNRSDIVLFAGSPTIQLGSENLTQPVVKRLPPGNSVLVYDPNLLPDLSTIEKPGLETTGDEMKSSSASKEMRGGTQPFCVRVSFKKGWGKNYTRMYITQCPCWVEIYLNI